MAELKLRADLPDERPVHAQPIDIVLADGWQTTVATVDSEFIEPEEVERRALLLAAAPELLAACQAVLIANAHNDGSGDADCDCDGDCDVAINLWVSAVQKARAAIAKARGEASRAS